MKKKIKAQTREEKKATKMRVSGKSVFNLRNIIAKNKPKKHVD